MLVLHSPIAVVITLVALLIDFWPRFVSLWHSLAGKTLILLTYAAATNFALPSAAGLVNDVTGLDASYFTYGHYTAILLSLPAWIFGVSIISLVFVQVFFPLFFFVVLCLRLIGIRAERIFKGMHYPVLTMLLRFALSILLLVKGIQVLDEINGVETEINLSGSVYINLENSPQPASKNNETKKSQALSNYDLLIKELLAGFIYEFDANTHSRCALSENARSIELNAYQHVEIMEDDSQTHGYRFEVKACVSPGLPSFLSEQSPAP